MFEDEEMGCRMEVRRYRRVGEGRGNFFIKGSESIKVL